MSQPPGPPADGPADRTAGWNQSPAGQLWAPPQQTPQQAPAPQQTPAPQQATVPQQTPAPQQAAEADQKVAPAIADVLVSTTDVFDDRRIVKTLGEVIGVVARSRDLPRKADPMTAYPPQLLKARQDAVEQMVTMARTAGANAVVGLRFDSSEISPTHSEVVAYGTAVLIEVDDATRFRRQG